MDSFVDYEYCPIPQADANDEYSYPTDSSLVSSGHTSSASVVLSAEMPLEHQCRQLMNKWYVPISAVVQNKPNILAACQRMMSQKTKSAKKFKWDLESCIVFARIVTKIGITKVKPQDIKDVFPIKEVSASMLGSHLQKYRQRLQKIYNLPSFAELENWMVESYGDREAEVLSQRWQM